mmetsp:Transcript_1290/g.2587  ORF Transcript_1290/g.2587 Transcript_1290/m.2587 type:complete len:244 (-) Transcript_1290:1420-2151(-)
MQQVATYRGIGQTGDDTDGIGILRQTVAVLLHAEKFVEILGRYDDFLNLFAHDLGHGLPRQLADFPLEIPHPRLAGIGADHLVQSLRLQRELVSLQAVVLDLLRNQMTVGNLRLLVLGVAGQRNDLHPVKQRTRHVVGVRRGQEHHVRKVVFHLEVVIHEGRVLLRIQHLEHCRSRVAPEILTHLVDFIEQDQWVRSLRLLQRLDDLAGHRADVGAAVAADLGLVADTTQGDPDELAPRGLGH